MSPILQNVITFYRTRALFRKGTYGSHLVVYFSCCNLQNKQELDRYKVEKCVCVCCTGQLETKTRRQTGRALYTIVDRQGRLCSSTQWCNYSHHETAYNRYRRRLMSEWYRVSWHDQLPSLYRVYLLHRRILWLNHITLTLDVGRGSLTNSLLWN